MKKIKVTLLLHSFDLKEKIDGIASDSGDSKSKIIRLAVDAGFPSVMLMSRQQIISLTAGDCKYLMLPRVSASVELATDLSIEDFAIELELPVWRIYSLSIEIGLNNFN